VEVAVLWILGACGHGHGFGPSDRAPRVEILEPQDGDVVSELDTLVLLGEVSNDNGLDDLASVRWSSYEAGVLGLDTPDEQGLTEIEASLPAGEHHLQLFAEDDGGLRGLDTITLTVEPADACTLAAPEGSFVLAQGGRHVASSADDGGVWVAWDRPEAEGRPSVWVEHLGCDGVVDAGPFLLDLVGDEPSVASRGEEVLVAWQSEGAVRWRRLDLRGPRGEVQEVQGALTPRVAATPTGWRLAAVEQAEVFTLALQANSLPEGKRVEAEGAGEREPALAVGPQGEVYLAWERDGQVVVTVDGALSWTREGHTPSLSADLGAWWAGWVDSAGDLWIQRWGAPFMRLRDENNPQHSLVISADREGGHAGWLVDEGAGDHRVMVGRFDEEGDLMVLRDLGQAEPYGLAVSHVTDRLVFVGWSDGPVLRGALVRL
jgi:hypothetical protein